jgi:hypothetical protein
LRCVAHELSYLLYEFLGTLTPLQAFAVVVIDEAQNRGAVARRVRILSDSAAASVGSGRAGRTAGRQKLKLPVDR